MKITKTSVLFGLLAVLSACVIHIQTNDSIADIELEETLSISAEGLNTFKIDAGAGSLEIIGVDSENLINVTAEIITTDDRDYTLSLESKGSSAYLVAEHHNTSGSWYGSSPYINLTVTMPKDMLLDVKDGSGFIKIENIARDVIIDDGSGFMEIASVGGDLTVDDGSGYITIDGVNGAVDIDDGSGALSVENVDGNVEIEDGSGELTVYDVGGAVTIDDGSGGIDVNGADALYVIDSGSGGLQFKNIKGKVEVDD